jgi:hypothetical protein
MKTPYRKLIHSVGWALCLNLTSLTATIASAETNQPHPLTVAARVAATSVTGTVPVQLEMRPSVVTHSLRVGLNGRPIDPKRLAMATGCSETANQRANPILPPRPKGDCMTGTLTAADGLKPGRNTLKVSAVNQDGSLDAESVDFGYTPPETQLGAADSGAYMPKSIGLTVSRGGTLPWVQITTGWPQPASPDPFSHPYYDQTFPTSNDTACAATDIYQVLVLDRTTPTNEIAYKCFDNDAKLTAYLGTLTASDLVIAGTTANNNATPSLDTTPIGGSSATNAQQAFALMAKQSSGQAPKDYSYSGNLFQLLEGYSPLGYVIIGAGGSTPGTAYESYYTASDMPSPKWGYSGTDAVDITQHAAGTLNYNVHGNYNFVSAEAQPFQVTPGDPATVTLGTTTYSSSQAQHGYHNGVFLLIVDRLTLAPMNWNDAATGPFCRTTQNPTPNSCGVFYPTGETGAAAAAAQDLAAALDGVSPRQIAILTTVGAALTAGSNLDANLAASLQQMGATYYTLQKLTTSSTNFTFVANGPDPKMLLLNEDMTSTFGKGVVEVSNLFSQQGETGNLWGLFARDVSGLYYALETFTTDGSAGTDFHMISTAPNGDWPMTDTAAHIAAYHYISNQYMSQYPLNKSGALSYDLRFWYDDASDHIDSQSAWFNGDCPSATSTDSFTAEDYCDVWTQLKAEIGALASVRDLFGDNGLRKTVVGTGMVDAVSASYTIGKDQLSVSPTNHVDQRISNWLRLAAGGTGGLSFVDPMFGVFAAALNVGATGYAMAALKTDPAQFETGFDVLLGDTSAYADNLNTNIPFSYDAAIDTIYSDWAKLQYVAAKHNDSNSSWQIPDDETSDAITDAIKTGATRTLYVQTVPNYYSLDTYSSSPVGTVSDLGMYFGFQQSRAENRWQMSCTATYPPNLSTENYAVYPSITPSAAPDIFVLGGIIANQNSANVSEAMPSQLLLDTLFSQDNLNLPMDLLYARNGVFALRTGPQKWASVPMCYKPGCSSSDSDHPDECVGP